MMADVDKMGRVMHGLLSPGLLVVLTKMFLGLDLMCMFFTYGEVLSATIPIQEITYAVDMSNEQDVLQLSALVDSLENLGVLDSSHTNCYTLDRIVKVKEQHKEGAWRISVNIYAQEVIRDTPALDSDINKSSVSKTGLNSIGSEGSECIGRTTPVLTPNMDTDSNTAVNGSTNGTLGGVWVLKPTENITKTTIVVVSTEEEDGGLSKTQIMVISTCSTVIGLFFLVALTMRVRNYIKRVRTERENRRTAYRAAHLSRRNSRANSECVSPSDDTLVTKGVAGGVRAFPIDDQRSNGTKDTPFSVCKSLNQDNKPLLVITSASAPSSPTFHSSPLYNPTSSHPNTSRPSERKKDVDFYELPYDMNDIVLARGVSSSAPLIVFYGMGELEDIAEATEDEGDDMNVVSTSENDSQEMLLTDKDERGVENLGVELNQVQRLGTAMYDLVPTQSVNLEANDDLPGEEISTIESSLYMSGVVGLTQSDLSIGSGNPGYSYGNQSEYQGYFDYSCGNSIAVSHLDSNDTTSIIDSHIHVVDPDVCDAQLSDRIDVDDSTVVDIDQEVDIWNHNVSGDTETGQRDCHNAPNADNIPTINSHDNGSGSTSLHYDNTRSRSIPLHYDENVVGSAPLHYDKADITLPETAAQADSGEVGYNDQHRTSIKRNCSLDGNNGRSARKSVTFSLDNDDSTSEKIDFNSNDEPVIDKDEIHGSSDDSTNDNTLLNKKREQFKKQKTYGSSEEMSLLLGADFEGMEASYV